MKGQDYFLQLYHDSQDTYVQAAPERVDWRWNIVNQLLRAPQGVARYKLDSMDDPAIRSAYEYRRTADRRMSVADFKTIPDAYALYIGDVTKRMVIEGLLLCDPEYVPYSMIAEAMHIDTSAVHAYASLFFDVRPYLDSWGWIFSQFFRSNLVESLSTRDNLALARQIAVMFGHEIFIQYYKSKLGFDAKAKVAFGDRIHEIYYKQALLTSKQRGHWSERDGKVLDSVIVDLRHELGDKGGDADHSAAMMAFLKAVPFTVADPSLDSNLQLPAREPRAHELIAVAAKPAEA